MYFQIESNYERINNLYDISKIIREYYNSELADEMDELIKEQEDEINRLEETINELEYEFER